MYSPAKPAPTTTASNSTALDGMLPIGWRAWTMSAGSLRADERAVAFGQGAEDLLAGDGGEHLGEVPLAFRFGRRLGLEQIEVADHAPVRADMAGGGHKVVDGDLAHFGDDRACL